MAALPAAWAIAALIVRGGEAMSLAILAAALLVFGGPAAVYLMLEFVPGGAPAWLWHICPVLLAWTCAAGRQANFVPQPIWGWLLWPVMAAVILVAMSRRGRKATTESQ